MGKEITETAPTSFLHNAIEAFGRNGAEELSATIIKSISDSQERLPLIRPMSGLKLMVCDGDRLGGFASHHEGAMELYFGRDCSVEKALEVTPVIVEHEYAHIAHGQHNPDLWKGYDKRHVLFASAIKEGIARHAEFSLSDDGYDPVEIVDCHPNRAKRVMQVIHEIMHRLPEDRLPGHYDFLFGDMTFPGRGYEVGHYIVASMAVIENCSLADLMKKPLDEFEYLMGVEAQ